MIHATVPAVSAAADDAEKPFWISFADLMTALMMLFLLVMSVALLTLTRASTNAQTQKAQRAQGVETVMEQLAEAARSVPGVRVDRAQHIIDFGDRARFDTGSHVLGPDSARLLRTFVPQLIEAADTEQGARWIKRVVVEGFADPRGSYLLNLNLSLQRGQRVLCALMDPAGAADGLGTAERARVRELFAVGGFSFNAPRESHEASRRIELRIEFYDAGETAPTKRTAARPMDVGECALAR